MSCINVSNHKTFKICLFLNVIELTSFAQCFFFIQSIFSKPETIRYHLAQLWQSLRQYYFTNNNNNNNKHISKSTLLMPLSV